MGIVQNYWIGPLWHRQVGKKRAYMFIDYMFYGRFCVERRPTDTVKPRCVL